MPIELHGIIIISEYGKWLSDLGNWLYIDGICSNTQLATTLIGSNLLRIGALNRIGHASVLLGKLIVCTVTCLIAWFLLQDVRILHGVCGGESGSVKVVHADFVCYNLLLGQVSSPLLPLLAILLFSYGVAQAFMTVRMSCGHSEIAWWLES